MFLLRFSGEPKFGLKYPNLHSNMFLLRLNRMTKGYQILIEFTFQYVPT